MRSLGKSRFIFIFLFVVILIATVLPVILSENAAITGNSAPAIAFGVCSVIYAIIAFAMRNQQNIFVLGKNRIFLALLRSMRDDASNTDSDAYRKEFALSAFVFCASIPFYIPLAFFAKSFYAALSSALSVTIFRMILEYAMVLIPRIVKRAQDKKQERIRDEADRKEQERRESMGRWS